MKKIIKSNLEQISIYTKLIKGAKGTIRESQIGFYQFKSKQLFEEIEYIKGVEEEKEFEKRVIQSRKEFKANRGKAKLDTSTIYFAHLRKRIKKEDITEQMIEKEETWGEEQHDIESDKGFFEDEIIQYEQNLAEGF